MSLVKVPLCDIIHGPIRLSLIGRVKILIRIKTAFRNVARN